jgi:hypothetical protein
VKTAKNAKNAKSQFLSFQTRRLQIARFAGKMRAGLFTFSAFLGVLRVLGGLSFQFE